MEWIDGIDESALLIVFEKWQFFDEWFLRLLNANHFVGGCSLFIYSIAIELYIFKIKKAHFCGLLLFSVFCLLQY